MERLNYTPDEVRAAFRYAREQAGRLATAHAGNWRSRFTQFIEAVQQNQEALKLWARLLDGHQRVSASAWFRAAADRAAPPMPEDRYERLALVWKLVAATMQKSSGDAAGGGFDAREKVDLPYVLVNSDFPGGSLAEKFEEFRVRYLVPFCEELDGFVAALEAGLPAGGQVDLWDAALEAMTGKGAGGGDTGSGTHAGTGTGTEEKPKKAGKSRKKS